MPYNYYQLSFYGVLLFLFLPTLLSAQQDCPESPSAQMDFSPNAITTSLLTGGDLWWDGNNGRHDISLPDAEPGDRPLTTIFAGGLWLTARDPEGRFLARAQQFGRSRNNFDFAAGPLTSEGFPISEDCSGWDKFFPITRSQIDSAILAFAVAEANQRTLSADDLPVTVLGWPGVGNPYFEQVHGVRMPNQPQGYAPFEDVDNDGKYDPINGDLPAFAGDQAAWCLFSSALTARESAVTSQLPLEIHLMAYGATSDNHSIDQTIFYDYRFISRGQGDFNDFRIGQWIYSEIGCGTNQQAESMPQADLFYTFNSEPVEPGPCSGNIVPAGNNAPINIFKILDASLENPDNEPARFMESFNLRTGFEVIPGQQSQSASLGRWTDGTPLTRGGVGYNPGTTTDSTRYMFDGGDAGGTPWRICDLDSNYNTPATIHTLFPTTLSPGETTSFSLAVTTVFDVPYEDGCPNRDAILDRANTVQQYSDDNRPAGTTSTGSPGHAKAVEVDVYPNPANGVINFKVASQNKATELTLFDFTGRRVTSFHPNASTFRLNLQELVLPTGTYLYQLRTKDGRMATGKLIMTR